MKAVQGVGRARLAGPAALALLAGLLSAGQSQAREAEERFERLEQRLLNADSICVRFHIESSGAVASKLHGSARFVQSGNGATMQAAGTFAGKDVDLKLESANGRLLLGPDGQYDKATPPALYEALVIGLTRMGLLHNLAMLSAGMPPDHGDGGVREWVQADRISGEGPDDAIEFTVVVSGKDSGVVNLHIDPRGLPLLREQTVHFAEGAMHVVERYEAFETGCPAGT